MYKTMNTASPGESSIRVSILSLPTDIIYCKLSAM